MFVNIFLVGCWNERLSWRVVRGMDKCVCNLCMILIEDG
jgi:hypothetical protein